MEKKWQLSPVMWTIENWEPKLSTAVRELEEEINIKLSEIWLEKSDLKDQWVYHIYVEDDDWKKTNVEITKYLLNVNSDNFNFKIPEWDEISNISWKSPEEIKKMDLSKFRPWAVESLIPKNKNQSNIVHIEKWEYNIKNWILDSLNTDLNKIK